MTSRGITWTVEQRMVTETCCKCGMLFAITAEFQARMRQEPGTSFFCPSGHGQHYIGETVETKLKRERDRLQQAIAYEQDCTREARAEADHQRHRANGYKGQAVRIRNRVRAGVCPCCNRTVAQLARHMATQHPDFMPSHLPEKA